MSEQQTILSLQPAELTDRVRGMLAEKWRFVHIGATTIGENVQLDYAFDRDYVFQCFRLLVPVKTKLPSISSLYWAAFLYENEVHDLFNLEFEGMEVDFHGHFYKTSVAYPFAPAPSAAAAPAKA